MGTSYTEFMGEVQHRIEAPTQAEAVRTTRAVLERVRDRMTYEDLDLETSFGRPSDVDESEVVYRIKAVVALLSELVPGGEIANVEHQLPPEFEDLFELVDAETTPWEQRAG